MQVSGSDIVTFTLLRFQSKPKTSIALQWIELTNGNWISVDRGASQDIYQSEISLYGTETEINNIIDQIEANRVGGDNYFTLSSFNEVDDQIFGADIDYSSSLDVTVIDWKKRKQKQFKSFTLNITLQLVENPYPYDGTPSLPTLRPLIGYTGDSTYTINKIDSYDNTFEYIDHESDTGFFEGVFILTQAEMKAMRRYLLSTIRGSAMSISAIQGVTYPFGTKRGGYPISVKVIDFEDTLININFWNLKIKLVENII